MSRQELETALDTIHRELLTADHLDPHEVERLRLTMQEIQGVLDQQDERGESLSDRVTHSARRFEESHPKLTENLGRVADILQQMGI